MTPCHSNTSLICSFLLDQYFASAASPFSSSSVSCERQRCHPSTSNECVRSRTVWQFSFFSITFAGVGAAGVDPDCWNRILSLSSLRLGDVCSCVLLGSHRLLSDHLHDNDLHQDPASAMDHGGKYTHSLLIQLCWLLKRIKYCCILHGYFTNSTCTLNIGAFYMDILPTRTLCRFFPDYCVAAVFNFHTTQTLLKHFFYDVSPFCSATWFLMCVWLILMHSDLFFSL